MDPYIKKNDFHTLIPYLTRYMNVLLMWLQWIIQWFTILGIYLPKRRHLMGTEIPIINLRRSDDCVMFLMGIPTPIRQCILSQ